MEPRFKYDVYEELKLKEGKYIVVTLHRDFNVDNKEKLEKIFKQLSKIAVEKKIVFPIHPRTKRRVQEFGLEEYLKDITVIEPVDYLNLMGLVKRCWKVITDSGGLQKEAYFAKKESVNL
jgi:UDP-N-acetylglucosamine 2-epimerase (non-hydrolysing)